MYALPEDIDDFTSYLIPANSRRTPCAIQCAEDGMCILSIVFGMMKGSRASLCKEYLGLNCSQKCQL